MLLSGERHLLHLRFVVYKEYCRHPPTTYAWMHSMSALW